MKFLCTAGTIRSRVAVRLVLDVTFRNKARASCAAFVLDSVRVLFASVENVTVTLPTIACSSAVPRFVLVVVPQVPTYSPRAISSIFRSVEYVDGIFFLLSNDYTTSHL